MFLLKDIGNLQAKKVLLRVDLNVPMQDGKVTNDARIRAVVPTIKRLLEGGSQVMLMSHLGRPKEGEFDASLSLRLVAEYMEDLLKIPIQFISQYLDGFEQREQISMLENVRFNVGEKANDAALGKKLAALADVVVMDAFAASHRAHASTHAVIEQAKVACAGPLLHDEIDALHKSLVAPKHPVVAIVGGAKVSTKLPVLEFLVNKIDHLIVGGGIANTFAAALGLPVGNSLCEHDLVETAKRIMAQVNVPSLIDVVVAEEFSMDAEAQTKDISEVTHKEMILDIGPKTAAQYASLIKQAGTVVMNGPLGVFEFDKFAFGTISVLEAIGSSDCYSLAGGGDTVAAVEKFGHSDSINYISTGGGAFLEYLEGKELPSLKALEAKE